MTVNFDIVPRQALTPADFKALGRAIRRWLRLHAKQQGSVRWYDTDGLSDLLKGVPVRLLVPEEGGSPVELAAALAASPGIVSPALESPALGNLALLEQAEPETPRPICLSLIYNKDCDHRHVMAAVRRALPTELVADVLIEGHSWDDQCHGEWIGVRRATS